MKRYITQFNARRHEVLAGSFAVLSMAWMLQLLLAQGGIAPSPAAVAEADSVAPVLGVVTEEPESLEQSGRVAEREQLPKPQPEPHQANAVEKEPPAAKPVDPKTIDRTEVENETTAQEEIAAGDTAIPTSEQSVHKQPEAESVVIAEPKPQPNTVEEAPKLVEEMSAEEIQNAVDAYMAWIKKGEMTLRLHTSKLSPAQLNSISSAYLLTQAQDRFSPSRTLRVEATDGYRLPQRSETGRAKWETDLPEVGKWPPHVVKRAAQAFGPHYRLHEAKFILADEIALKLFRFLARSVGNRNLQPGDVFDLRLVPDAQNQIQVELAN